MQHVSKMFMRLVCAAFFGALITAHVFGAEDQPPPPLKPNSPIIFKGQFLRGITSMTYEIRGLSLFSESENDCRIDFDELQVAIDRMLSDSRKVRFMRSGDHLKQLQELSVKSYKYFL